MKGAEHREFTLFMSLPCITASVALPARSPRPVLSAAGKVIHIAACSPSWWKPLWLWPSNNSILAGNAHRCPKSPPVLARLLLPQARPWSAEGDARRRTAPDVMLSRK